MRSKTGNAQTTEEEVNIRDRESLPSKKFYC